MYVTMNYRSMMCDEINLMVLQLIIDRRADWWIGSFDHPWFKLLERSIYEEWGVQPLRIREGGVSADRDPMLLLVSDLRSSLSHQFPSWKRSLAARLFIYLWARAR